MLIWEPSKTATPNNISFRNPEYLSTLCSLAIKRETLPILPLQDPATSHWCSPRHTILKSWINNTSLKILVYNSQLYCSWAVGSQQKAMIPPPQEPCNSQECQHKPRSSLDLCLICLPFGVNLLAMLREITIFMGPLGPLSALGCRDQISDQNDWSCLGLRTRKQNSKQEKICIKQTHTS